ncbi:MAG: hypothetical protein ACJ8FS_15875 [Sphingomicrobium sp.]
MSSRYVEPQECRFIRERVDGVEQLRIPMRRNWFVLIFLSVWLTFWTFGGIAAGAGAVTDGNLFVAVWLVFWAFGWVFAATTIALQIGGSEIIRVIGRDLEISIGAGRWRRRKLYRGDRIRNLQTSDPNPMGWPFRAQRMPFPGMTQSGSIKFDYGAKTVRAAGSVDEAEGRMILDWLRPKLPASASEPAG